MPKPLVEEALSAGEGCFLGGGGGTLTRADSEVPTAATSSTADVTEHTQAHHISPDDFFREISGEIDSEVGEPATSSAADVAEHVEASRTLQFAVATSGFSRDLNLEVREPAATADASIAQDRAKVLESWGVCSRVRCELARRMRASRSGPSQSSGSTVRSAPSPQWPLLPYSLVPKGTTSSARREAREPFWMLCSRCSPDPPPSSPRLLTSARSMAPGTPQRAAQRLHQLAGDNLGGAQQGWPPPAPPDREQIFWRRTSFCHTFDPSPHRWRLRSRERMTLGRRWGLCSVVIFPISSQLRFSCAQL